MRILLVDDEKEFVSALAERLHMRGYDADWASTGEDALKMVTEMHYDLAILDLKMPNIGGLELRSEMIEMAPNLKFMFITGHGSLNDFAQGCEELAECCIGKPMDLELLIEKLREVETALGDSKRR